MSDWVPPLVGVGSACLVAAANFFIQRWRYRIDRLSTAIDQFCAEVCSTADIATNYWLLDTSQHDDAKKARELEAKLIGSQLRLQAVLLAVQIMDSSLLLQSTQEAFPEFFEHLTGGDFSKAKRASDPERARAVQGVAAQIVGKLRAAVSARSKLLL